MRIYLQALDYEIWEVVCDGLFMPLTKNEVGEDIPKPSREWNELEKRKATLNSKAMNALFCALDKKEFHRVSSCESANEIWHKLEVLYEGTNQVKESKISRYTRQYELFQMEQNESVYYMYTRFTDIVNTLGAIGKTFSNSEKVKKIIRSLRKEWRQKRTAIEEAKDLNILPIDDLVGSLISYEEDLAAEKGNEEKKKSIALKASKYESDEESELDEEEMDMLARKFRNFFKKSSERRKFRDLKNQKEKNEVIKCYECKKPGHIRSECPLLNKLKKKAMVATWDDSEEETSDDEEHQEMTNLALMAIGDESDDELDEVNDLPTYDELHDTFKELHDECMKIDPGVLKDLNRMDFGLFGRSWAPIVSWAVLFVPRANEDAWRGDLPPAAANNMDAEVSFDVVASGYTNGYRPIDKNRPIHGLRTMVQLDELYKDRHVQEGGSLVLQINLIEVPHGNVLDSDHTFDGKVYWHLYSN
ncbi:hypothetical protein KPL71_018074 [Citrus sinensis]|uniref:Uncharacterized protein n=1 Tax=Citrus sinensis TaxID=2711 RepID=A0ACB8JVZ7_CITSI|nr:hypothetical protein KPL71_018074 [Citrus sinensis]